MVSSIAFASSNRNKYNEVRSILSNFGILADFSEIKVSEVQSDSIEDIAVEKAKSAFAKISKPLIVEDDGLFIESLKGFPGPYSSYAFATIGNEGILKLLASKDRYAYFKSVIAYFDDLNSELFVAHVRGQISDKIGSGGWGYDPIFVPEGAGLSFGELKGRKSEFSHRRKALEKFAKWYLDKLR